MAEEPANGAGPLSWRDVYKAVADSETRILAAVNQWGQSLTSEAQDHEVRLRVLEQYVIAEDGKEAGLSGGLKVIHAMVLVAAASVSTVISVIMYFSR